MQKLCLCTDQDLSLDFRHIATLWKLDSNRDGVVTFEVRRERLMKDCKTTRPSLLEELVTFAEFCNDQRMMLGDLELSQKLKAEPAIQCRAVQCALAEGSLRYGDDYRCVR